jgi:hypothetical protein
VSRREWKPGDVALVDGCVALVWREEGGDSRPSFVYTDRDGDSCSVWANSNDARTLVVIDPEDREQVERVLIAMTEWAGRVPYSDMREDGDLTQLDAAQAALRSLIEPPRPEEPTGLGAVVEDADGATYTRLDGDFAPWYKTGVHYSDRPWRYFKDLTVVRVLSEGVTA